MKIICNDNYRDQLQKRFNQYEYLDIILVEKGIAFNGLAYIFDINHLDEVEEYLQQVETSTIILYGEKNERLYKIDIHSIVYIEGFSREAYVHTLEDQYQIKEKLYQIEEKLSQHNFIRVSKSLIINCRMIDYIEPLLNMKYRIYLKNNEYVELTRSYMKSFKNYLKMR